MNIYEQLSYWLHRNSENSYKVHCKDDSVDHLHMVLCLFIFEQTWRFKDVGVLIVFI
jgi:hypothetical protein